MTSQIKTPPSLPFPGYKWKWATTTCTESLNDPVVLLGVLRKMRKLENTGLKYSSLQFSMELVKLSEDIADCGLSLETRGGDRNLIRNSGQYWKALGLIPSNSRGLIELTDFGRKVADGDISQGEFAALSIRSFKLPNPYTSSTDELSLWKKAQLEIQPLMLILSIVKALSSDGVGWITPKELAKIVIPLAGAKETNVEKYEYHIIDFRENPDDYSDWPDCTPSANDMRMVREYLLFLDNYGYLICDADEKTPTRFDKRFLYNKDIDAEITDILSDTFSGLSSDGMLAILRNQRIASGIDSKRIESNNNRPDQAAFRRQVLDTCKRCVITNAAMPEILQAAHIKPHKYNGPESVENGFAMRMDIHKLYDTNHLRISPDGVVEVSDRARMDYGMTIPPRIDIPDIINREYLRWRWDNYVGLC